MRNLNFLVVLAVIVLCYPGTVLSNDSKKGIPLTGEYVGPTQPEVKEPTKAEKGKGEDGVIQPVKKFQDLPVIEKALAERAACMDPAESLRVIIHLAYQPQDVIAEQVRAKHAKEMESLEAEVKAIKVRYAQMRDVQADTDAENYRDEILGMSYEDEEALRALNERHETLSLTIKKEIVAALSQEIETYQQSVKDAIPMLGGKVEFGTIAGNAIIAVIPAGVLDQVAAIDKVARVVEDRKMKQDLNIADDATKVSYGGTDGLWGSGNTGGTYDPAVVDSGTDMSHPALENDTDRDNFYSYYLVAAAGDPEFNDEFSSDDLQGHGTHVMGIVGSYGSAGWADYLGMSYGVEKAVTLKAGCRNTSGNGFMYWSDAMYIVDRGLYHDDRLYPLDTFNDDVDGINLSYGGETTDDETDYSRFWDSVVSSYLDLVVTISAGNSGPSNTYFRSPACNYNAITVANVDDKNTADRDDDVICSSSTRGPTENGRRKPDIAAPGTHIQSCNNDWETGSDFVNKTGTSMSAPMVLGVAMDLMEAGVHDEKEIKALLINTAQKNEPGIDFESDSDGWSEAYGWGYMNAQAAYYHRNDVRTASVTERLSAAGYYRLYKGQMRDEGSGSEGRDRVTMVWNRHATYNPHDYPTTYYNLSDLDLRLYKEDNDSLIDMDLDVDDNVHQVRINAGAGTTDVVVKAYAYNTDFPHGGMTETFALATEEDFVEVGLPASFGGTGLWPSEMEPNEERDFEFWLRNDSDIASHNNQFKLILPSGWTKVSGPDVYDAGSIAGEGGYSSHVTWRLRAQSTAGSATVISQHTHHSYGEAWGPFNWDMSVTVRETTPPTPNPMTWSTEPYETSTSSISMVATTASDPTPPISYYFGFYSSPTFGKGGNDSSWQSSTSYTDSGLGTNHQYGYRVRARDGNDNRTSYSSVSNDYTDIETPSGITFDAITTKSIQTKSINTPSGLTRGSSGLRIYNITKATDSGWTQNNNYWTSGSLSVNTLYGFRAKARNGDADETGYCSTSYHYTLANAPGTSSFSNVTQTSIRANWTANGNPSGTEYYCENTTASANSGWTTNTYWNSTGLTCGTSYTFRVKARNGNGTHTGWTNLGSQSTQQGEGGKAMPWLQLLLLDD